MLKQRVLPTGQLSAAIAVQSLTATIQLNIGGLAVLQEIVRQIGLKPGDVNPFDRLLPSETSLGGLALVGLMANNGDALITTPSDLPKPVIWDRLAANTTEPDIRNQLINIDPIFPEQGVNTYGLRGWRIPNMNWEDGHIANESLMLRRFSQAGGHEMFGKLSSPPVWSDNVFWSARCAPNSGAYYQWEDTWINRQYPHYRYPSNKALPVHPVQRVSLSQPRPT